jgi:hypothetical protein
MIRELMPADQPGDQDEAQVDQCDRGRAGHPALQPAHDRRHRFPERDGEQ